MRIPYYGIYEIKTGKLEVYNWVNGSYRLFEPNERGHYPIEPLGVELGLWSGSYYPNQTQLWLRWWDREGNLLLIGSERAEQERARAEQAEKAQRNAIPRLVALGLSVEQVASALSLSVEQVKETINP
jgi:hypothetical protein